jgi:DNA-binding SARP family transcriptional activator
LQEDFHLALLRHQLAAGRPAAARQHFEHYRRLMRDELGQEPAAEALRLAAALHDRSRFAGA